MEEPCIQQLTRGVTHSTRPWTLVCSSPYAKSPKARALRPCITCSHSGSLTTRIVAPLACRALQNFYECKAGCASEETPRASQGQTTSGATACTKRSGLVREHQHCLLDGGRGGAAAGSAAESWSSVGVQAGSACGSQQSCAWVHAHAPAANTAWPEVSTPCTHGMHAPLGCSSRVGRQCVHAASGRLGADAGGAALHAQWDDQEVCSEPSTDDFSTGEEEEGIQGSGWQTSLGHHLLWAGAYTGLVQVRSMRCLRNGSSSVEGQQPQSNAKVDLWCQQGVIGEDRGGVCCSQASRSPIQTAAEWPIEGRCRKTRERRSSV